jgi:hypothetical protein
MKMPLAIPSVPPNVPAPSDMPSDAALVEQRELDTWRLAHPETRVAATGYTHSIGFNIGFVGLSHSRTGDAVSALTVSSLNHRAARRATHCSSWQ